MATWLRQQLVLVVHERLLAAHGGKGGLRDERALESALARSQQLFVYGQPAPDLADLAAAVTLDLARQRPFANGNARTALACCLPFLELNNAPLSAAAEDLHTTARALAEDKLKPNDFAAWRRGRAPKRGSRT